MYITCQRDLFDRSVTRIQKLYPKAHIHVLTNEEGCNTDMITYHHMGFVSNHICKFQIYGLLTEPAMYVDCDVMIIRPFEERHLAGAPFNCFTADGGVDLQQFTPKKLPIKTVTFYNAGLIWIPGPNKTIVDELQQIHEEYFNDIDFQRNHNKWSYSDEYSLSYYIAKHGLKMNLFWDVNAPRQAIQKLDKGAVHAYQSIHYTGIRAKSLLYKELSCYEHE